MIILDTNVIAELMREVPDSKVASWIQRIDTKNLALAVMAIAEILRGIERLPKSKRRQSWSNPSKNLFKNGLVDAFTLLMKKRVSVWGISRMVQESQLIC